MPQRRLRHEHTQLAFGPVRPAAFGFALAALASGCAVTQRVKVSDQNYCPFLGANVCAQLTPTTDKKEADLRYVNPSAQWTQYNKVLIEPVTFRAGTTPRCPQRISGR